MQLPVPGSPANDDDNLFGLLANELTDQTGQKHVAVGSEWYAAILAGKNSK
jgi:hypothetical protein